MVGNKLQKSCHYVIDCLWDSSPRLWLQGDNAVKEVRNSYTGRWASLLSQGGWFTCVSHHSWRHRPGYQKTKMSSSGSTTKRNSKVGFNALCVAVNSFEHAIEVTIINLSAPETASSASSHLHLTPAMICNHHAMSKGLRQCLFKVVFFLPVYNMFFCFFNGPFLFLTISCPPFQDLDWPDETSLCQIRDGVWLRVRVTSFLAGLSGANR